MKTEVTRLFTWIAYLSEVFKLCDYIMIRVEQFGLNKGIFKLLTQIIFLFLSFFNVQKSLVIHSMLHIS